VEGQEDAASVFLAGGGDEYDVGVTGVLDVGCER
jgi:hypothetical protein